MSPRPGGPSPDPAGAPLVYGVHAVIELLETRRSEVEKVFVAREGGHGLGPHLRIARQAGIPIVHLPRQVLSKKLGPAAAHQGVAAQVAAIGYADVDELCRRSASRADALLVVADRVVDPRNLGALIRTAAAAGAAGLILSGEETVGLTPVVAKVAAGSLTRIPVAREARPARRLDSLRQLGFSAYVLDPRGPSRWDQIDLTGRIVLVAGGEARGARPAVARACDGRVGIPLAGGVESLNVSVALGVLLFEAVRQRGRSHEGLERSRGPC